VRWASLALAALAVCLLLGSALLLHLQQPTLPAAASQVSAPDLDHDGIPDAVENAILGTDPHARTTVGALPGAWVADHALDITDPNLPNETAPYPRPPDSPAVYGPAGLPAEYRMTLAQVYAYGRPATWDETKDGLWGSGLDPKRWDVNGTGVPYSWLIHFGLDPKDATLLDKVPSAPGVHWTPREAYQRGLSPVSADGDADGLLDEAELQRGTSPRLYSTTGSGIADGWLVLHGFDPLDPAVPYQDTDHDGLTNLEEFQASMRLDAKGTLEGKGLDPRSQSTGGSGIPDGWLVKHGLNPLEPGVGARVTEAETLKRANGTQEHVELTVKDEYAVNRPPSWNESVNGPWWGGTDPTKSDTDGDGLTDLEEILGFDIRVGQATKHVVSDPTKGDTDGDGLPDPAEVNGRFRNVTFSPTDPSSPDTDGDGLTDGQELGIEPYQGVTLPVLNPNEPDSDHDGVRDGEEAGYWIHRYQDAKAAPTAPYPGGPPDAKTTLRDVFAKPGEGDSVWIARFMPGGDLDGDGIPNLLDPDSDGDGLLDGWEVHPEQYRSTQFASDQPRSASDPANADTDRDGLPDGWEVQYGAFDSSLHGWNLDPAKWSSFGDGASDADKDLDGDSITWYSYAQTPTGMKGTAHQFVASNLVEYKAGSDPNRRSSSPDGIPDGWKIFWGSAYIGLSREDRGVVYPGAPGDFSLPSGVAPPRIGADDRRPGDTLTYRRYQPANATDRLPWETVVDTQPAFKDDAGNPAGYRLLAGTVTKDYAGSAENGTNPYVPDTDGDGMPDLWEGVWARLSLAKDHVSPVVPDASGDPDHDTVKNLDEYRAGTDPYRADSDFGGATDDVEITLHLNPMLPGDDAKALDSKTDTDGDGIPDVLERLGQVGADGHRIVTDPNDMDTDHDGLLDGKAWSQVHGRVLRLANAADNATAKALAARGLTVIVAGDGTADVPGEESVGSDPTQWSTSGTGIPDGWAVQHGFSPLQPGDWQAAYGYGRPAWWSEPLDGVWHWGLEPGQTATRDMDKDGLDDFNGEDPIPIANPHNVLPLGDPTEPGISALDRLMRSQAYGEPRNATPVPDRIGTTLQLDPLPPSLDTNGTALFSGNLTTTRNEPVANATVLLSLGTRDLVLGVAITNETGGFRAPVLLATSLHAPDDSNGIPVFGRSDGQGVHDNDAKLLGASDPTRSATLFAWAYNVSPFEGGRQGAAHHLTDKTTARGVLGSQSASQTTRLNLSTTLALVTPAEVRAGDAAAVNATLLDGLGRPVPGALVDVEPVGATARTGDNGTVNLTVLPQGLGPWNVSVSFAGDGGLLPSSVNGTISVREPTLLSFTRGSAQSRPGQTLALPGILLALNGTAIPNAPVDVSFDGEHVAATTKADGSFDASFDVSPGAEPGDALARVSFGGDDLLAPSAANLSIQVVGVPTWRVQDVVAPASDPGDLAARLVDASDRPIPNASVTLLVEGRLLANRTNEGGLAIFPLADLGLAAGTHTLVLGYSDPVQGSDDAPVTVTLFSPTTLSLDAATLVRGAPSPIEGRLTAGGAAVPGAFVRVSLGDASVRARTDADGRFEAPLLLGNETPLGPALVEASYPGTADGILLSTNLTHAAKVEDAATLTLSDASVKLRAPILEGKVKTLLGDALPDRSLGLTPAGGGRTEAVSATDGSFAARLNVSPATPLGPLQIAVSMPSEDSLVGIDQEVALLLRDDGTINASVPATATLGDPLPFDAQVVDSVGRPVPDAKLRVTLDGVPMGVLAPGAQPLALPKGATLGQHTLQIAAVSRLVDAQPASFPLLLREAAALRVVSLDPGVSGGTGRVTLHLATDAAPLAGRSVLVTGVSQAALNVTTDAHGDAVVTLPAGLRPGSVLQMAFGGDGGASAAVVTARVPVAGSAVEPARASLLVPILGGALLLLVVAALLLWRYRATPAERAQRVLRETARALRDPRADIAILHQSYKRLLRLAGLDEDSAERLTFADIMHRIAPSTDGARGAILTLTEIYNHAVYAPHLVDRESLVAAADALSQIAAEIDPTQGPLPPEGAPEVAP